MCKSVTAELELGIDIEDRVCVGELPKGTRVTLHTANRDYLIETCGGAEVLLQGHPYYCPDPVLLYMIGCSRPGAPPEPGSIRRGMRVEFWDCAQGIVITTSRVRGFRVLPVQAVQ